MQIADFRFSKRADIEGSVTRRLSGIVTVIALASLAAGCAVGAGVPRRATAPRRPATSIRRWRTTAPRLQAAPDNPNYKIALERAMLAASRAHFDKARAFEAQDQLEAARGEYRLAERVRPDQPPGRRQGRRARSDDPRAHRGGATPAGHRAAARARARRLGAADAEPGLPRAAASFDSTPRACATS